MSKEGAAQVARVKGKRYAHLANEHWSVAPALLEGEVKLQPDAAEGLVGPEETLDRTVLTSKELAEKAATALLETEHDENEEKKEIVTIVREGPRKQMGPRFRQLYKEHFAAQNLQSPDSPPSTRLANSNRDIGQDFQLLKSMTGSEVDQGSRLPSARIETVALPAVSSPINNVQNCAHSSTSISPGSSVWTHVGMTSLQKQLCQV
jgi:hypothetical protein